MTFTVENIPYISLMWIGIGFVFILVGIFILAHLDAKHEDYTGMKENEAKELFSFFLEEEEKKNESLRKTLLQQKTLDISKAQVTHKESYDKIIQYYEEGLEVDEIARQLNLGKGEVQLILSLYAMR